MCALSTDLSNELTIVLRRGSESGTRREVSAPEIIVDYNQFMGGVDLQQISLSATIQLVIRI